MPVKYRYTDFAKSSSVHNLHTCTTQVVGTLPSLPNHSTCTPYTLNIHLSVFLSVLTLPSLPIHRTCTPRALHIHLSVLTLPSLPIHRTCTPRALHIHLSVLTLPSLFIHRTCTPHALHIHLSSVRTIPLYAVTGSYRGHHRLRRGERQALPHRLLRLLDFSHFQGTVT
jgi:hypothetical protein